MIKPICNRRQSLYLENIIYLYFDVEFVQTEYEDRSDALNLRYFEYFVDVLKEVWQ